MWEIFLFYINHITWTLLCLFCVRIFIVYLRIHNPKKVIPQCHAAHIKIMIILGSGGHTFEMLRLVQNIGEKFRPRIYIVADTDNMSQTKAISLEDSIDVKKNNKLPEDLYMIENMPRSREVGQSWTSSVITTFLAFISALKLVFQHKPELILCNGPGTCVPICIASFLLHVLCIKHITVVYVESICRVEAMSLSGKILYHFADQFLVQWPQLQKKYPRAKYIGQII